MSPPVLVVEHHSSCPPALLGEWLTEAGCTLEVCRPWAGDELPDDLTPYGGLLVLGGDMGAYDDDAHPWLGPVKVLLLSAAAEGRPTLGVCLGHQLLAVALGGRVVRNPGGQAVGLYDVGWSPAASSDELFGALAAPRRGVQWNSDVVSELPPGAVVLAETPEGDLQVARFADRAWGVQLHPEVDEHVLLAWAEGDRAEHLERGIDQEAVLGSIADARHELDEAWQPLAASFASVVERAAVGTSG